MIPPGVPTGPLAVGRGQVAFPHKTPFEVLNTPTLTSFMPTRGAAGAKVTLTGTYLTGAEVYYGARKVKVVTAKGDGALVVEVPADARDESFRVKTRGGEAESAKPFQPALTAFTARASHALILDRVGGPALRTARLCRRAAGARDSGGRGWWS